jgi:phenylacetate-coenzyme A ligase PaaK-like adenylate-forming protein
MILLPGDRPNSVGDLLAKALLRMNVFSEIHGFVYNPQSTVDAIINNEINCLVGVPVQVLSLVRCGNGKERLKNKIKAILLTTDHVPKAIVEVLTNSLNCAVYNHYGMTEMGWGGGVECEAHDDYHMREADLFIEIVDPKTGRILPDGKTGEIVITTLSRDGMPLIRYRTGDMSMFHTSICPCGTILKRMKRITNRLSGIICLSSDTQISMAQLDEVLFLIPEILDFEVSLSHHDGKNQLAITLNLISDADRDTVSVNVKDKIMNIPAILQSKIQIVIKSKFDYIYPFAISETRKRTILDNRNK